MRPRRALTQIDCFIRAVPFQSRIQQSRASSAKTKTFKSQAAGHTTQLQPLVLTPSTAYLYTPLKQKQKQKRDRMMPQSVQIPGLTLINNLTPHAIAPTSEGGFISAGSGPRSQGAVATTTTMQHLPPRKKENKKAKARRLLAEAEAQAHAHAQAHAQAAVMNHNGYAHPPNQYVRINHLSPSELSSSSISPH